MDPKEALNFYLLKNEKFHIEFHPYFTNHTAHGLTSLYKLGASSDQIAKYYDYETKNLEPAIPSQHLAHDFNWKDFIGKHVHFSDLCEYFNKECNRLGVDEMINTYFKKGLIEGISGRAFHGTITLGFGIISENKTEIIRGLAYYVYAYLFRGFNATSNNKIPKTVDDIFSILTQIREDKNFDDIFDHKQKNDFQKKFEVVLLESQHINNIEKYNLPSIEEKEIENNEDINIENITNLFERSVIELFAFSDEKDFFILHGITSLYALKIILSKVKSKYIQYEALRYYWKAVIAVYISQGRPQLKREQNLLEKIQNEETELSWNTLIEESIKSFDTHIMKLCYICREQERVEMENNSKGNSNNNYNTIYKYITWKCIQHVTKVLFGDGWVY